MAASTEQHWTIVGFAHTNAMEANPPFNNTHYPSPPEMPGDQNVISKTMTDHFTRG